MLQSRPDLSALMVWSGLVFCCCCCSSLSRAYAQPNSMEALELNALHSHQRLLLEEIERLYQQPLNAETELLIAELQQRQLEIQPQIEALAGIVATQTQPMTASPEEEYQIAELLGRAEHTIKQQVASTTVAPLNLSQDFELLQRQLDQLKQQIELMDQRLDAQTTPAVAIHKNAANKPKWSVNFFRQQSNNRTQSDQKRDAIASTAAPISSSSTYFWTPLLAMPEFPQASIAQSTGNAASPSLIKRLLAILRPGMATSTMTPAANTRHIWRNQISKTAAAPYVVNVEELLGQVQEQRKYFDEAISRLELLATQKKQT